VGGKDDIRKSLYKALRVQEIRRNYIRGENIDKRVGRRKDRGLTASIRDRAVYLCRRNNHIWVRIVVSVAEETQHMSFFSKPIFHGKGKKVRRTATKNAKGPGARKTQVPRDRCLQVVKGGKKIAGPG